MRKTVYLIIIAIVVLAVSIFTGLMCCSYKPIWIKELPTECNMTLNVYKMYYKSADKSAIIPMTDYCVKKLHRQYCREEVFGTNPVNYDDSKLYRNYSQCLAELK